MGGLRKDKNRLWEIGVELLGWYKIKGKIVNFRKNRSSYGNEIVI